VRRQAKARQDGEPAQVETREGPPACFGASELNREAGAEEQRKRPVRLGLDQTPDERPDHIVDAAWLAGVHMEMDDEHAEQCEAAQQVQRVDPFEGVDRERAPGIGQHRHRDYGCGAGAGASSQSFHSTGWRSR
jgi:hypothetical protein